jgi:hypothetical protein
MRKYTILAIMLVLFAVLLSGCKTVLLVHDATVDKMSPVFKDYAGSHGYAITYANDKTGSYHLDMGAVFIPESSSSVQSTSRVATGARRPDQPMTSYEETTWNTVSNPAHYVEAMASISIIQQDKDVLVTLDGNDAAGNSLNDFSDYVQSLGYTVENK